MNNILVSVIVCTFNREQYIERNLKALSKQSLAKEKYEIVIINNNSTDNTQTICESLINNHPELQIAYFNEKKQGHSYARNKGIQESKGEYLAFIDDDAFVDFEYTKNITEFFSKNHEISTLGGKIIPIYEEDEPKWMSKYLLPLVAGLDMGSFSKEFPGMKFPIGANMAYRSEIFKELGNFNTDLGRKGTGLEGGDEKDMIYRLKKAGKKVWYVPEVLVEHIIPAKRTQPEYIKGQAIGVGKSERKRLKQASVAQKIAKIFDEIVKIIGTFVLVILYSLKLQFSKSVMLIKFRLWVILGYFKRIN